MHATSRAIAWRKSSRSGDGNNCVELAPLAAGVGMRDSKDIAAGVITLAAPAWSALVRQMKEGRYDLR